jgi:hypothetical protein
LLVTPFVTEATASLAGCAFKPYAGAFAATLPFAKTDSGGTDRV